MLGSFLCYRYMTQVPEWQKKQKINCGEKIISELYRKKYIDICNVKNNTDESCLSTAKRSSCSIQSNLLRQQSVGKIYIYKNIQTHNKKNKNKSET